MKVGLGAYWIFIDFLFLFIFDHSMVKSIEGYVGIRPWKLYFDDSRHNDGTELGVFIISPEDVPTKFKVRVEGSCSKNAVEYEALITCL